MKGNYTEAIKLYSRAIELDGSNAIYFSNSMYTLLLNKLFL